MYAIIATGGKQYKVAEGDVVKVEKLGVEEGKKVSFDQVLLIGDDKETLIGNPTVKGAKVTATVTANGKGEKVIVYKYKRKSGYHNKNGHRQLFTEVKIEKIQAAADKAEKAEAKPEAKKTETKAETEKKPAAKKTTAAKKPAAEKAE